MKVRYDSNEGLGKNVTWRHGITQALGLPLHDAVAKSRVMNSGWNFMLIVAVCNVFLRSEGRN